MQTTLVQIGEEVIDSHEECFYLFSGNRPGDLGILEPKLDVLEVTIAGRDFTIRQSPTKLASSRDQGTTGAVAWRSSVSFAEWLVSPNNSLFAAELLHQKSTILELGAGIAGLVALSVGPRVEKYIATDQDYVMKTLKQNIVDNAPRHRFKADLADQKGKPKRAKPAKPLTQTGSPHCQVDTLALDWELDNLEDLLKHISTTDNSQTNDPVGIDAIVACDCIFNEALVKPFVETCRTICQFRSSDYKGNPTFCIIAQQLRSPDVFEHWITTAMEYFHIWRVRMPETQPDSALVVHPWVKELLKPYDNELERETNKVANNAA